MRLSIGIWLCCMALLLGACHQTKIYERHKELAYTKDGAVRTDGYFYNTAFMDALTADMDACYAKKAP